LKPEDLKRFGLLVEFTEEDRSWLAELLDVESICEGETVFCEGDEADSLYLVESGSLRISSEADGALGLLCEGAAFGSISVVIVGKRQATATAESDCKLMVLTRGSFRRLADDAPRTACRLTEAILTDLATGLRTNLDAVRAGYSTDSIIGE
jgi:CRP-like cAMP-binding protein